MSPPRRPRSRPGQRPCCPVHLSGNMADLDGLRDVAAAHDLVILEDAAQAHGSSWQGKHAGTLGDAGTFSFQASKNMTAGEGGVVICRDPDVLARLTSLANCGRRPGAWFYRHFELASNLRMTEWQGAVLRAQLQRFPAQQADPLGECRLLERRPGGVAWNHAASSSQRLHVAGLLRLPGQVRPRRCSPTGTR